MRRLTTLADRLLSRFVPETTAAATGPCSVQYVCDGGPKYKCTVCPDSYTCDLVPGWCW